jgi:hypothetical protein
VEGTSRCLIEVLFPYLSGGADKNHKNSVYPGLWPRFEPNASGIRVRGVTATPGRLVRVVSEVKHEDGHHCLRALCVPFLDIKHLSFESCIRGCGILCSVKLVRLLLFSSSSSCPVSRPKQDMCKVNGLKYIQ